MQVTKIFVGLLAALGFAIESGGIERAHAALISDADIAKIEHDQANVVKVIFDSDQDCDGLPNVRELYLNLDNRAGEAKSGMFSLLMDGFLDSSLRIDLTVSPDDAGSNKCVISKVLVR